MASPDISLAGGPKKENQVDSLVRSTFHTPTGCPATTRAGSRRTGSPSRATPTKHGWRIGLEDPQAVPYASRMRTPSPRKLSRGRPGKWNTEGVLLGGSVLAGPVDLAEIFGNARPVEVEVGTGKGTFLIARASARPEVNFLGIEQARAYAYYAADRFGRAGLENVRMACIDAGPFFRRCLGDRSIWRVHVYFPDPWPKRRHHRRRLIQPPFVEQIRRVLQIGGQLILVTDHLGYFDQIANVLHEAKGLAVVPQPKMSDTDGELVGTNFERKYIAQGRAFYGLTRMRYR